MTTQKSDLARRIYSHQNKKTVIELVVYYQVKITSQTIHIMCPHVSVCVCARYVYMCVCERASLHVLVFICMCAHIFIVGLIASTSKI